MLKQDTITAIERIKVRYAELHPASRRLYERAQTVLAGGTSHNFRTSSPFPLYWTRGEGAQIWDLDGDPYVDYALNGASALIGHGDRRIVDALAGYDPGCGGATNTELEVEWGESIKRLYPAADLVRFTGSGSDSTTLAFRLVRAFTGKERILRFARAYHGWHDHSAIGYVPDDHVPTGIPRGDGDFIVTASLDGTLEGVEQRLAVGDIAGMIVEPSGAGMGINPLAHEKLTALRALARDAGVPFICDENITGFRWAPGGIQSLLDLDPDITLLGKIATGGFPGGVVAGKATLMEQLADGVRSMVGHSGTYNGHPVVATAGIAMIDAVKDGAPQRAATAFASELKDGLNRVLSELGVAGFAYGPASTYWMYLHAADAPPASITPGVPDYEAVSPPMLSSMPLQMIEALYCGLCCNRVFNSIFNGGFTSSAHTANELDQTVSAYAAVLVELRNSRVIAIA